VRSAAQPTQTISMPANDMCEVVESTGSLIGLPAIVSARSLGRRIDRIVD
jgi:hypothetical protein